ncbi:MAG: alpha-galactosidase [Cyclobacteriaceae bacterium]|nr:alpha-galactosidase [Cyclobacteriaceae bacterium]UYN85472.1 MAG: alpha-galactosidase [Cyclobacteriaceae bacterium]
MKDKLLTMVFLMMSLLLMAQQSTFKDCYVTLEQGTLEIGNSKIKQTFRWNGGNIILEKLTNLSNEFVEVFIDAVPDFFLKDIPPPDSANWRAEVVKRFSHTTEYLRITITQHLHALVIQRIFEVHPEVPAIATYYRVKGSSSAHWMIPPLQHQDMIEDNTFTTSMEQSPRLGSVSLKGKHYKSRVIAFQDATDHHNNLVREQEITPYRKPIVLPGNIVLVDDVESKRSFFILKESPLGFAQQAYPGFDFVIGQDRINITGLGMDSNDLQADWTTTYGFVIGVADADQVSVLSSLRSYQKTKGSPQDEMILMNTWGDRGRDSRMSESFVLAELEKAKRLGITHVQLDDGWQAGLSRNSANKQGLMWDDWTIESWQPHPERFPRGLAPVMTKANELKIEIGLWFNPSKVNSYAQWQRDADILIDLHRQWGIYVFKIDGIELTDKRAEENLRKLFERVKHNTEGRVIFNFDVTAGKRLGYHYFTEFGNIFLENRYTDWGNYYPHWTLRNLWQLSRYVPPEKLQVEFLNKWRNLSKYPVNDLLAPANYTFDYLVAITLMAQPLAWLEATNLPKEAFDVSDLLKRFEEHRFKIHSGIILPIGEEPDGSQWTGFQSMGRNEGYFLVFREFNEVSAKAMKTHLPPNKKVRLEHVAGNGKNFSGKTTTSGSLTFSLPKPRTFALYRYIVQP